LLKQVSLAFDPKDEMYVRYMADHYLSVGISAIRCVNSAVEGTGPIRTVLDLPCGYGRVMRFLKVRFPHAIFTACELNPEAVEFCKGRLAAQEGVISNPDPGLISISQKFDLIWCGSLVTHLEEPKIQELLRFFYEHLQPGGVCVFTTQGERCAQRMEQNDYHYGLSQSSVGSILKDYRTTGFGYADYNNSPEYGITLVSREKMNAIASPVGAWRETLFIPKGWDNHQDVYAFAKSRIPAN
jgi:SAM-dependent methyltransferase